MIFYLINLHSVQGLFFNTEKKSSGFQFFSSVVIIKF